MNLANRQRGMTFLGWVFTLGLIGAVSLLVLKLVPMYMESFKVDKALESLVEQPNINHQSATEIYKGFVRRMNIEDVKRFTERNVRSYVLVEKNGPNVTITVEYQAKAKLFRELSLVADFVKTASNS